MQITRIVQAVALMMIVALAASCAASKEYTSKIFAPRDEQVKDSQAVALIFLDMDSLQTEKEGWVSTDIIMGRDTTTGTTALDNLAKIYPAKSAPVIAKQEMADTTVPGNETNAIAVKKQTTDENNKGKETISASSKDEKITIATDKKAEQPSEAVVVKNTPYGTTRTKKSRTEKP